jgi:hypothetical protein
MSVEMIAFELVGGSSRLVTHIALITVVGILAVATYGLSRWRHRREAAEAARPSVAHDRPAGNTTSAEE